MQIMTRNELRKAIVNHPRWSEIKRRDGLNSESLSAETLRRLQKELGITEAAPVTAPTIPDIDGDGNEMEAIETVKLEDTVQITMPPTRQWPVNDDGLSEDEAAMLLAMREAKRKALEEQAKHAGVNEARILELIEAHAPKPAHIKLTLLSGARVTHETEGLFHYKFVMILSALQVGLNVMLVGPAGSGKTTLGEQCAKALNLPFYFNGAISSEFKLSGFIDAQGRIISTAFRKAFETGGVYLFDEIDASMPQALLAFNAALANGHADFPDGNIARHPDFRCIAAANTFGTGASRIYVGRNQLDAASTDRFIIIVLDYDTGLEAALLNCPRPSGAKRPLTVNPRNEADLSVEVPNALARVRRIREAILKINDSGAETIRHVVSPRASMAYAKLLAAGWAKDDIEQSVIWKGLDAATRVKIEASL